MVMVDDLSMRSAAVGVLVPFQFGNVIVFIFTISMRDEFWLVCFYLNLNFIYLTILVG